MNTGGDRDRRRLPLRRVERGAPRRVRVRRADLDSFREPQRHRTATPAPIRGRVVPGPPTTFAISERRYAAELFDRRDIGVRGAPGHAILVDIANLHQNEITPGARAARALIVFVRNPHPIQVRDGYLDQREPALLIAGYANSPDDFDGDLGSFIAFLNSIEFVESR